MAFREILEGLKLPQGANDRYRKLEGLERMLAGTFYDELPYSFDTEKGSDGSYIPMRNRRPSMQFNLAYEIVSDTQGELFGDEQFPTIRCSTIKGKSDEDATTAIGDLIEQTHIDDVVNDAYLDGACGGVAVLVEVSEQRAPHYEVLPAKWCEPIYRGAGTSTNAASEDLLALVVTYPINADAAEAIVHGITAREEHKGVDTFWYRFVVGPSVTIQYEPLADGDFAHLGEKRKNGSTIEFVEFGEPLKHGFDGVTPAIYVKNLGGRRRDVDGMALWWPAVDMCVGLDYSLSQLDRGLRFSADPMLFVRKGGLDFAGASLPAGYEKPAGGMATQTGADGTMVRGATQTLVGQGKDADAKLLEISGQGLREEREFAKDIREMALEVIGGMKARAEHVKGAASGKAIDKQSKPLRRVVRRQRRPYGDGLLLGLVSLTLLGIKKGLFEIDTDGNLETAMTCKRHLEWPNDETLQGTDLQAHALGLQLLAGGSAMTPVQLIKPEAIGAKAAADAGMHQPYETIAGTGEPTADPEPEADPEDPAPDPKPTPGGS